VNGPDQLQYLSWLVFILVFVTVLVRTIGRPTPAHIDMTLFFGDVAILIILTSLVSKLHLAHPEWLANDITGAAAMSMGYLLLRLVRDFSDVPKLVMRAVEVGLVASVLAIVVLPTPLPAEVSLLLVAYLLLVLAYDTWAFNRQATVTRGVTKRRMQAAAAGSLCLGLALFVAGLGLVLPGLVSVWSELGAAFGLGSSVCYFVGFAPPTWLRRTWQEPEVRAFLGRAASLPRLPSTGDVVLELERRTADALGAPDASIALWDADSRRLRIHYRPPPGQAPPDASSDLVPRDWEVDPTTRPVTGRAFLEQRAVLVTDAAGTDPNNAATFERYRSRAILSAPITAGEKRLGVLIVYAPRAPVFANSDLELVQFMADQAAVILESRALIEESANVRAREEAVRLKEDFLSSAAHDLKTPLTSLVTQAQVLHRRAERNPDAPTDRAGLNRLVDQSLRLKDLMLELLDASRLEHASLLGELGAVDLGELLRTMVGREATPWSRVHLEAVEQPVVAMVDAPRFEQVLTNLIENALKYSRPESAVVVSVGLEDGEARISVHDRGIGIPIQDQPLVFERFHRARNVDDRRFAGMGLGLYIARAIVVEHGGRIWLDSAPDRGTTFSVAVPAFVPATTTTAAAAAAAAAEVVRDGSLAGA
jgi:signal transduction histidine kinase